MTTLIDRIPGIASEEIERARQPLDRAYTLPPNAYLSERVFALEETQIMRKSWIPLARVDQLAEPGQYMSLDLLGQPVMVVHGTDGAFRVMSRVCLHRAAPIAEGDGKRKLFTCPYHAWSYDTTGQLIRAPLMEGADGFSEKDCQLPQIKTEIWNGFILANLDPEAEPFAPQVADYSAYFLKFKLEDMVVVKTLEFDSPWNWKVLVENFMEAYHHIATHAQTFEPIFHARDSKIPDNTGPWSILHMPSAHDAPAPGLPPIEGLEDWQKRDLFATVLFPHFMLAFQGTGAAWYQVFPNAADQMLLKIHLLSPKAHLQLDDFAEASEASAGLVNIIHHEDIDANDKVWTGLNAPLTQQGRLSPLEKSIWQMNQWWLDRMSADA
ncbi:MAG: aromatic ring-hydroxylating dioxygenase subunit alpha [Pseudomonadota bacterium]